MIPLRHRRTELSQAATAFSARPSQSFLLLWCLVPKKLNSFGYNLQLSTRCAIFGLDPTKLYCLPTLHHSNPQLTSTCFPQSSHSSHQAPCRWTPRCFMSGAFKLRNQISRLCETKSTICQCAFACTGPATLIAFNRLPRHQICKSLREHARSCACAPAPHAACLFFKNHHPPVQPVLLSYTCVPQTALATTVLMGHARSVTLRFATTVATTLVESAQLVKSASGVIKLICRQSALTAP